MEPKEQLGRGGREDREGLGEKSMGLGDPGENRDIKGSFAMDRPNGAYVTDEDIWKEKFYSHPAPSATECSEISIQNPRVQNVLPVPFHLCPEDLSLIVLTRCFK